MLDIVPVVLMLASEPNGLRPGAILLVVNHVGLMVVSDLIDRSSRPFSWIVPLDNFQLVSESDVRHLRRTLMIVAHAGSLFVSDLLEYC